MTKDDIRKEILQKRNSLSREEITDKSRLIHDKVLKMDEYKNAENILIYASMGSEVKTDDLINDALEKGKKVYCPKCTDTKNGVMEFIRISHIIDLKKGYYGIREPEINDSSAIYIRKSGALVLMPLVAFDESRNRIGYKGGYYDRFLEKNPELLTVGLAFDIQKSGDIIPADFYDIKPCMIVTENATFL